jgi:hypothetical protein
MSDDVGTSDHEATKCRGHGERYREAPPNQWSWRSEKTIDFSLQVRRYRRLFRGSQRGAQQFISRLQQGQAFSDGLVVIKLIFDQPSGCRIEFAVEVRNEKCVLDRRRGY